MNITKTDHHLPTRLVLASASKARGILLRNAGLQFDVIPADIDEDAVKRKFLKTGNSNPFELAEQLAYRKAEHISRQYDNAIVIGADQVLEFCGQILSKPETIDAGRKQLLNLRGKTHHLISAVSLWSSGSAIWSYSEQTNMTMRRFSAEFLEAYIEQAGPRICESVGGYQLESEGIQLFEQLEGDFFTILGLPLLPLLAQLRDQNILSS